LIVGREIRANAMPATIIGVMPPALQFPVSRTGLDRCQPQSQHSRIDQDRQFEVFIEPRTEEAAIGADHWRARGVDCRTRSSASPAPGCPRELAMLPMSHYFTDPPTRRLFQPDADDRWHWCCWSPAPMLRT
jgi:hypothetical protein